MNQIEVMQARLDAADGLAETLAAAWDAFELLLTTCDQYEDRRDELFAAFAFASAAAAEGRNILTAVSALPPRPRMPAVPTLAGAADPEKTAEALAALARALSARLSATIRRLEDSTDRAACRAAAREAGRIHDLLSEEG